MSEQKVSLAAAAETAKDKKFRVSVSQKAEVAAAATGDDLGTLYFPTDDTSAVYIGKQRYGLSADQKKYLDDKLAEQNAAKVGVSLAIAIETGPNEQTAYNGQVLERGVAVSLVYTAKTTYDGKPVDATGDVYLAVKSTDSPTNMTKTEGKTGEYTHTRNNVSSTPDNLSAFATVKGVKKGSNALQPKFFYPMYSGVYSGETITATEAKKLAKAVKASAKGTYTFDFTADKGYAYLVIPPEVGLPTSFSGNSPQGSEGPLPVLFTKLDDLQITVGGANVAYKVFRIADKQGESTHNVTFS